MIVNVQVTTSPVAILQGTQNNSYAIILITITNLSDTTKTFDIYVCQNGKNPPIFNSDGNVTSGDKECIFLRKQSVSASASVILDTEKILLGNGDRIYIVCNEDSTSLVATISYETY